MAGHAAARTPRRQVQSRISRATRGLASGRELIEAGAMRLALAALLAAAATCPAQKAGEKEGGGRLYFPAGAREPAASPTPGTSRKGDKPAEAIEMFFLALKGGQVNAAYDALVKDTIITERREDVTALKEKTSQALDSYGPVTGFEVVDEKVVGSSLLRRTCVSLNTDLPLRWRFYFYKSAGAWKLVDLRVDDGLVELFEEAGARRTSK